MIVTEGLKYGGGGMLVREVLRDFLSRESHTEGPTETPIIREGLGHTTISVPTEKKCSLVRRDH